MVYIGFIWCNILEGIEGVSCGRSINPSGDKQKTVISLRNTCFVHLFSSRTAVLAVPLTALRVRYNPDIVFFYWELSYFLGMMSKLRKNGATWRPYFDNAAKVKIVACSLKFIHQRSSKHFIL